MLLKAPLRMPLLHGCAALCLAGTPLFAQTNATAILTQLQEAIAGSKTVSTVTASGTATWYQGSLQDTGPATISLDVKGNLQLQLDLAKQGKHTESVVMDNAVASCTWTNSDGVSHPVGSWNCWKPLSWLFPPITLQLGSLLSGAGVSDRGSGTLGGESYRHLQSQLVTALLPMDLTSEVMVDSTTDVWLDPVTLFPSVVTYQLHPDNGAATLIPIQLRYLGYRKIDGVNFPMQIDRYVNGALQLSLSLNTASIN